MTKTKLVLLGTGTPNACPENSGPASAIIVNDQAYLIDFGPGVYVRHRKHTSKELMLYVQID